MTGPALRTAITLAPQTAMGLNLPAALSRFARRWWPPATRILAQCRTEADEAGIRHWLKAESQAPGAAETRDGAAVLLQGIAMAEDAIAPDSGHVIGQIWRKLQPLLCEGFNLRQTDGQVTARLIGFGEGLKRYSYGPPVFALREMQALIAAGIVLLRVADDPEIGLIPGGWRISEDGAHLDAPVLIDAVLPAPKIEACAIRSSPSFVRRGYLWRSGRPASRDGPAGAPSLLSRPAPGSEKSETFWNHLALPAFDSG